MKNKSLSCGVIVTSGVVMLLGHSTGNRHWDIPKGGMHDGETPIEAALRELKEETGMCLKTHEFTDLGRYEYTKRKDLHLFLYKTTQLPDITDMVCESMCVRKGRWIPEFDAFKYVHLANLDTDLFVTNSMSKVLKSVILKI